MPRTQGNSVEVLLVLQEFLDVEGVGGVEIAFVGQSVGQSLALLFSQVNVRDVSLIGRAVARATDGPGAVVPDSLGQGLADRVPVLHADHGPAIEYLDASGLQGVGQVFG